MIRDFCADDAAALREIHARQELGYELPDLESPLCLVKKVRVVDGRVVAAMLLRITCETYLLVEGSPVEKFQAMQELQPEVLDEAYRKGIDDVVCVVPPTILKRFLKRLTQLGWSKDREWPMFSRRCNAK